MQKKKWKLTVKVSKTKVVTFQRVGRFPHDTFTYNGGETEIFRELNYLGYVVSSGGTVQKTMNLLAGKAVRAMELLFSTIRHVQVSFKMLLQLFDSYDKSILNYSCETWGFSSADRCKESIENS